MTTKKSLVLGSLIFNLTLTSGAWAKPPQLTYALDQAQAAKASYQAEDTQQASAHTRAALGHVEVLRRDHKTDKDLKTAEADLALSLKQNKSNTIGKASQNLDLAIENLVRFSKFK
jgi:hypothetical protein